MDYKAILEVCEKATPGPWKVETQYYTEPGYEQYVKNQRICTPRELVENEGEGPYTVSYTIARIDWSDPVEANAEFISLARTTLPELVERCMALEKVAEVAKQVDKTLAELPMKHKIEVTLERMPFIVASTLLQQALAELEGVE